MTQSAIDRPGKVRDGEALDVAAVHDWLKQNVGHFGDSLPEVSQYSGGASNWTYQITYPDSSLILRRAPAGTKAKGAHDMGREYRLQKALKPVYSLVPSVLGFCDDSSCTGSEFYVMEKIKGIIPRNRFPREVSVSKQQAEALCNALIDSLVALHKVDIQQAQLAHLGKGEGYITRQIAGWCSRYQKAKTWNVPAGHKVMRWLEDNMPTRETICLTHNDFRFDNIVLDPNDITRPLAVLDWELATLGDPLMDVGNALAYWVEPGDDFLAQATRRQPTHLEGMISRKEWVNRYTRKMAIDIEDFRFYEVYGLFRLAVIAQQIYYRYHHRQTRNPAFKRFWIFVHYLLWRCQRAINGKSL